MIDLKSHPLNRLSVAMLRQAGRKVAPDPQPFLQLARLGLEDAPREVAAEMSQWLDQLEGLEPERALAVLEESDPTPAMLEANPKQAAAILLEFLQRAIRAVT